MRYIALLIGGATASMASAYLVPEQHHDASAAVHDRAEPPEDALFDPNRYH
jgi:hypothetical protein